MHGKRAEIDELRQLQVTMTLFQENGASSTFTYTLGTLATELELQKHLQGFSQAHGRGVFTNQFAVQLELQRNKVFPNFLGPVVVFSGEEEDRRLAELVDDVMMEEEGEF